MPTGQLGTWNLLWWTCDPHTDIAGERPDAVVAVSLSAVIEVTPDRWHPWIAKVTRQGLDEWRAAALRAEASDSRDELLRLRSSIDRLEAQHRRSARNHAAPIAATIAALLEPAATS